MAPVAQINGYTVHRFGDKHKQSMKCRALRVIIIDEVPQGKKGRGFSSRLEDSKKALTELQVGPVWGISGTCLRTLLGQVWVPVGWAIMARGTS